MTDIRLKQPVKALNSLQLSGEAAAYIEINQIDEIQEVLDFSHDHALPIIPLGDGTNVVFSELVPACLVLFKKAGYRVLRQDGSNVFLQVDAGYNWHAWVDTTLEQGWFGLENLALIPGTVGAAPVQNIGAYGVEVDQTIVSVTGVLLLDCDWGGRGETITLSKEQCEFSYRNSLFKRALKQAILITSVEFCLPRHFTPRIDYPALHAQLQKTLPTSDFDHIVTLARRTSAFSGALSSSATRESGESGKETTICQRQLAIKVRNAVVVIRQEKLPDPDELPNAGSFFKNPVVPAQQLKELLSRYSDMPHYLYEPDVTYYKVAAAWLIEQCGFKGHRQGVIGMHNQQALVLVHYPEAEAVSSDVLDYADSITEAVFLKFGISLEIEPQLL